MASESDGYGVGGLDDAGGEDEEVGYVCEDVAQDDEGKRGVDDAGEVSGGVLEFGGYIVDLVGVSAVVCLWAIVSVEAHVVPAVEGPQTRVQSDSPIANVVGGAVKPALLLPVGIRIAAV